MPVIFLKTFFLIFLLSSRCKLLCITWLRPKALPLVLHWFKFYPLTYVMFLIMSKLPYVERVSDLIDNIK